MSLVGPSICVVTEKTGHQRKLILDPIGLEISVSTKVDNKGILIAKKYLLQGFRIIPQRKVLTLFSSKNRMYEC